MGKYIRNYLPPGNKRGYIQPGFNEDSLNEEQIEELAQDLIEWVDERLKYNEIPLLVKWCVEAGVIKQKVAKLVKKNEMFSEAHKYAKQCQETKLLEAGIYKDQNCNEGFIRFLLSSNADYTPKESKRKDTSQDNAKAGINNFYLTTKESLTE